MPKLQEGFARRADAGVAVLGLSIEDEEKEVANVARTCGARFPVAWDEGHRINDLYPPPHGPAYYVIDRSGIVRFVNGGYHDGGADELDPQIASLL